MNTVEGKCGIRATVLADSISEAGVRFTTFEVEYPRIVHAELMTHRVFSRNAASSRAIPFAKMLKQLTGRPVRFGKNVSGMQDDGEHTAIVLGKPQEYEGNSGAPALTPEEAWEAAKEDAVFWASAFADAGYHKQITGRLTESHQMMKTIISATEWGNWNWLRDDGAADPTIAELARVMKEAHVGSSPVLLKAGEYHLPYVDWFRGSGGEQVFFIEVDGGDCGSRTYLTLEEAIKVSCARCASVSYRNEGYGLEKSIELYDRLVGSDKKHASALEHCATPMKPPYIAVGFKDCINLNPWPPTWEPGVTHADRKGHLWSGNLKEWIQHRKLIPGENYEGA